MPDLKMWIVKREVLATSLVKAATSQGRIYEITEAAKEFQPDKKKIIGYKNKKNGTA